MQTIQLIQQKLNSLSKLFAIITAFVLPLSTTLTDIFFISTIILILISGNIVQKLSDIFHNPVAVSLIAFYCLFIIGLTYTSAPLGDALSFLQKYQKILFAAFLMPIFREKETRDLALSAFLVSMILVLFLSYLQIIFGIYLGNSNAEIFRGHIAYNFLLAFAAYLVLGKIFDVRTNSARIFFIIIWWLFVYNAVFLSIGRSGYIILFSLTALFFLQAFTWKKFILSILVLVVIAGSAYTISPIFKNRIDAAKDDIKTYFVNEGKDTSLGDRINFVRNSVKLIKNKPIIGYGTGSFKYEYEEITPKPTVITVNPHNEYLLIGVQFGIVGIVFLLAIFGLQLYESRKLPLELRYISQAVVVSIMLGCLGNSWLLDTAQGHFYAYFIALTFAALNQKENIEVA